MEGIPIYQELLSSEVDLEKEGSGVRLIGVCTILENNQLLLQDEGGEIVVRTTKETKPDASSNGAVCAIFGMVKDGKIFADAILPLNLDFAILQRVRRLERRK